MWNVCLQIQNIFNKQRPPGCVDQLYAWIFLAGRVENVVITVQLDAMQHTV